MKTMKTIKTCCALLGAATLLTAPNLFASINTGTIDVNYDYGNHIFNVDTTPTSGADLGSFQTFCLNSQTFINTPGTYSYTTSAAADPGNSGGVVDTVNPDPISIGTAWLYSQFRTGTLSGYTGSAADNTLLQQAFWWLENDIQGVGGAVNNSFIQTAETALSLDDTGILADAGVNNYGVFALNMVTLDANGRPTQDKVQPLLGMVPEPSTIVAGALLLLPFGVSTLRIMRKNKLQ
jgi:hypothetical protein